MNKKAIQTFAMWAREELLSQVAQRAYQYGITAEGSGEASAAAVNGQALTTEEQQQRRDLLHAIAQKGYDQVMEEVAYTWFNRFIALRFMEVNNYLPSHVRVFSDGSGAFKPEILHDVLHLDLPGLDREKVAQYLEQNQTEALYRYLLLTQCNALNEALPQMFERMGSYTELLFPNNILRPDSVLGHLVADIPEEDWTDLTIGWLYQFYESEKHDQVVNINKSAVSREDIPAATQLFTTDWVVHYIVDNSLGRYWIERHPESKLREKLEYLVLPKNGALPLVEETVTPQELTFLDPCVGSGHVLVYAFEVLMEIYKECGYSERDAVSEILQHNLFGLDIDPRAIQLAHFAVMMKARQYNRRILTSGIKPNLFVIDDNRALTPEIIEYIADGDSKMAADLRSISDDLTNAREYGSIINVQPVDFNGLIERIGIIAESDELNLIAMENKRIVCEKILPLVKQAQTLSQKYDVVCTNPPYMGGSGMNSVLSEYVKRCYSEAKSDLFAAIIIKCLEFTKQNGYSSLVTMQSWMFLSSFEEMRTKLLTLNTLTTLMHMENMVMGIAFGTAVSVFRKGAVKGYKGTYNQIKLADIENAKPKSFPVAGNRFAQVSSDNFSKIPGMPVAYWVSEKFADVFKNEKLYKYSISPSQNVTGNNDRFVRKFWELSNVKVGGRDEWIFYAKGGGFRKWWGNLLDIVNWTPTARYIYQHGDGHHASQIINKDYWYRKGITWGLITSSIPSFRVMPEGATFDKGGSTIIVEREVYNYALGLLNSKVFLVVAKALNPTLNFQVKDICSLPLVISCLDVINSTVDKCIDISQVDWDSFETSWDFKTHPLLKPVPLISESFAQWSDECEKRFTQLKSNEEELNRIFIDIYGLQDELTPEVEDKDVTVRRADLTRDIKSLVSYAVGCMFGRYSLDVEGLAYAGGEWDGSKYKTFIPDPDNCIPVTDEEYFRDDIVVRFVDFIRTVYGADTLEENLTFIADALGTRGNTSRERIRNYFLNDFIKDHIKMYQKRPIYWMFDSGKQNGFRALVYMHRWNADTTGNVRVEYLHKLQRIYENEIRQSQDVAETGSGREVSAAQKRIEKLTKQLKETHDFDEKIAHLALSRIDIDLDDGVKVNYEKVQTGDDGKKIEVLTKI